MDYPKSVPSVGLVGGKFVDEDPLAGTPGSLIPAQWGNAVTQEIINVLTAAGLVPDELNNAQLLLAISNLSLVSQAQYALGAGSANAITATYAPAITSLADGMVLKFKALSTNTGAATFNPNGLGAKAIVGGAHAALQGGEIAATGDVWLQYNASVAGGAWVIIAGTAGSSQLSAGSYGGTAQQFDNSQKLATTAFVKKIGAQFSATTVFATGPQTLTAAMAGTLIDCTGAYSGNMTLPSASSVPDGTCFTIWSGAGVNFNLLCSGSDAVFVNQNASVSSITIRPGGTLTVEKSPASNAWIAVSGSEQLPFSTTYAGLAPKPISGAGVGAWQTNIGTVNTAYSLPAGGTWAYFAIPFTSSGAQQTAVPPLSGVAAGGSIIATAVAAQYWYGFCWRIQ
ncbi:hypothetical protein [Pseudomonas sp. GXM4]|uniref:hypothetical protein n=1 Tax=Pseudomonas sp. GXM4 TaxID=2651867 RepID=UPI002113D836|nr:hypothetical protein [Pseudomonas sp. GXM4]